MHHKRSMPVFSAWPQLLCVIVTSVMAVSAVLALIYLEDEPATISEVPLPALASAEPEQSSVPSENRYLMKNHGGKLAVFRYPEESPLLIFDVYVSTLPAYDQRLLQEGIPAAGEKQLTKLIEDYVS